MRGIMTLMLTAAVAALAFAASPDLNGDGWVNLKDYDLLAAAVSEGRYVAAYDIDGNGELDIVDCNRLLEDENYIDFISGLKKEYTVGGVTFTMVGIEGGTFTMGATAEQGSNYDSDERPTHQVTLDDFMIGVTEVTEGLWKAVMGNNPSYYQKGDTYPIECVSWNDCQTFITKLNELTGETFRLPTEAEWEFAARGGNKSKGYKYAGSNTIGDVAWYRSAKQSVATKAPNELGLYDMSGNVYEWCLDWYSSYTSAAQTNPIGPTSGSYRVTRGGGWSSDARSCRVSGRYNGAGSSFTWSALGLRLAR